MRKFKRWMGLTFTAVLAVACTTSFSQSFTITGKHIKIAVSAWTTSSDESSDEEEQKWLNASISVTHESTDQNGTSELIELATGQFEDGKVTVTGKIDKPVSVKISASVGEEVEPISLDALLEPGRDIKFALIEYEADYLADKLILVGESLLAVDKSKSFSISGMIDTLELEGDLETTYVTVQTTTYNEAGSLTHFVFGEVLLDNGKFRMEAEVAEPTVVNLYLDVGDFKYWGAVAVVEPGADIAVRQRGERRQTYAFSTRPNTGLHSKLVDSWQNSSEYLSAYHAYEVAYEEYQAEEKARQESSQSQNTTDSSSEQVSDSASVTKEDDENASEGDLLVVSSDDSDEEGETLEVVAVKESNLAKGCEHVDLSAVENEVERGFAPQTDVAEKEYQKYQTQMWEIERIAKEGFARNLDEPMYALLALEMGAFHGDDFEAVQIYDELAGRLDAEFVARRVTPRKNVIVTRMTLEANERNVAPGQKAPKFVLVDLDNNEVDLHEVAAERDLVLLDFWASWCGPCIKSFPKLKELYSVYKAAGFEVVSVAIDETAEDWEIASEEQQLPWINLGENKGWDGPTTVTYGVRFIPKSFLIDSEGCILQKDLQTDKLEELLVAKYGEVEISE